MNFVNKITISVIVPFYNSEKHLSKCILSIIEQDNKSKFEIIMVDDGSTDHSLDIIKNFDNNIKVFSLPENCGPAAARNLGLKKGVIMYSL